MIKPPDQNKPAKQSIGTSPKVQRYLTSIIFFISTLTLDYASSAKLAGHTPEGRYKLSSIPSPRMTLNFLVQDKKSDKMNRPALARVVCYMPGHLNISQLSLMCLSTHLQVWARDEQDYFIFHHGKS